MKRISAVAAAFSVMALVACGAADDEGAFSDGAPKNASNAGPGGGTSGGTYGGGGTSGSSIGTGSSGSTTTPPAPPAEDPSASPGKPANTPQAGQLTAGVWDDNLNFDFYKKYLTLSGDPTAKFLPVFTPDQRDAARLQLAQRTPKTDLDLTFLLDTTGSMGDELSYLQAEIDSIAQTIAEKHPGMQARFNLVVYRDDGDAYLSKGFQWGSASDLQKVLAAQSVGGGGDYPEAVAAGLQTTVDLDWRSDAKVARMAFWVADAPHHENNEATLVRDAILEASQKDIHLYPVAASGTDARAEFTMRTAAQMTGGRYIFLTNDSGIGNDHAEPHIPCYQVTRFDGALVRMVESELSGQRVAPAEKDILRTVGNPTDGKCTISSGTVAVY